jgi:hypothetical protein
MYRRNRQEICVSSVSQIKQLTLPKVRRNFYLFLGQVFYFDVAALAAVFRFAEFAKRLNDEFRLNDGIRIFYYWFSA